MTGRIGRWRWLLMLRMFQCTLWGNAVTMMCLLLLYLLSSMSKVFRKSRLAGSWLTKLTVLLEWTKQKSSNCRMCTLNCCMLYAEFAFSCQSENCNLCDQSLTYQIHQGAPVIGIGSYWKLLGRLYGIAGSVDNQTVVVRLSFTGLCAHLSQTRSVQTDQFCICCNCLQIVRWPHTHEKATSDEPRTKNFTCSYIDNKMYLHFETNAIWF